MVFVLIILAMLLPRLTIFLLWFFTSWFNGVFHGLLIPILGFLFLPVTMLWYVVVVHYFDNSWTMIPVIGLIIAILIDLSPAKSRRYHRSRDY
ncbi:MAG: hypothetical protein ACM3RX_06410 [Methanococcaceae archaeon]